MRKKKPEPEQFPELSMCGKGLRHSVGPTEGTPHKPTCNCTILYSSDSVCHKCQCPECVRLLAEHEARCPKPTDFELLKRKLNDFGCQCRFDGEHDGVRCEELDHDPCLVCLVNRVQLEPAPVREPATPATAHERVSDDEDIEQAWQRHVRQLTSSFEFREGWKAREQQFDNIRSDERAAQMKAKVYGEKAYKWRKRCIEAGLATDEDQILADEWQRLEQSREAVLREVAIACGNSGDMYIERAEHWIRETFGLERAGT